MQKYTTQLLAAEEVARDTMAFTFATPEGFTFVPGQYIRMTIPDMQETDNEGNNRRFSIASAPADNHLRFATRMRDTAFKRALGAMRPGASVVIEGPMGGLTLPEDPTIPVVFLAGGIGITPFIGMAHHAAKAFLMHNITLFYSNRTPEDSAFLDELRALMLENPSFHMVATMTDLAPDTPWNEEKGYIDAAMLRRHLSDTAAPMYLIAGPPTMISAMQKVLTELGVNELHSKTEEFEGY